MFYPNVPWVATERETRFLNDYQVAISLLKPGSLTFFRGSNQVFTAKRGTQFTDPIIIAGLLRYFLDQGLLSAFLRLDIQVLRLSAYFLILPHPLRRDFGFKLKEIPKNNLLIKQFFHEDNW